MVPGITDPECCVAEFRYRELLAEADRQRRAASAAPAPASRVRATASIGRCVGAAREQVRQFLLAARLRKAQDHLAAAATVAMH